MRDASGLEWYNVGIKIYDVEERLRVTDRRAERLAHQIRYGDLVILVCPYFLHELIRKHAV